MSTSSVQLPLFTDFVSNPVTPTEHLHGPDEVCPVCEETRARAMHDPEKLRKLPFPVAAEIWLEGKKFSLKPRTLYGYEQHIEHLTEFFGTQTVGKFHIGHVLQYQRARLTNEGNRWICPVGPSIVKHEVIALKGILGRAGEWKKIGEQYKALPMPPSKRPKVMSDEEELRLFYVASTTPEWQLAYWVADVGRNTGAVGAELRYLKIGDLHLDFRAPGFRVASETAKNKFRVRWVALNTTALQQMRNCLDRAKSLGCTKPEHYLFPFRVARGHWEPTKPASSSWLRRQWKDMVIAADLPHITPHCMRHQHATISLEAGQSEFEVAKRLGHRNPTMLREVYGHGREDIQKAGVDMIDPSVRFAPRLAAVDKVRAIR